MLGTSTASTTTGDDIYNYHDKKSVHLSDVTLRK